ncbi:MAG: hypothetical protein L0Z50_15005 [Verrucomicrobiales bacterium]|nr:hypothetical protein [Verrucomicrobiales bacterium]
MNTRRSRETAFLFLCHAAGHLMWASFRDARDQSGDNLVFVHGRAPKEARAVAGGDRGGGEGAGEVNLNLTRTWRRFHAAWR